MMWRVSLRSDGVLCSAHFADTFCSPPSGEIQSVFFSKTQDSLWELQQELEVPQVGLQAGKGLPTFLRQGRVFCGPVARVSYLISEHQWLQEEACEGCRLPNGSKGSPWCLGLAEL